MISRLRGILETKKPNLVLIDVGGVGYEVQVPLSTLYNLPECGSQTTLLTHHYVREDAEVLYGFFEESERSLFRALIKITGVGPKLALTILSGIDPRSFLLCIERKDTAPLVRLPGVGQKTAERLLVELAGKLQTKLLSNKPFSALVWEKTLEASTSPASEINDAISALMSLGYKPQEASRAVSAVREDGLLSQELIRRALQGLAKV